MHHFIILGVLLARCHIHISFLYVYNPFNLYFTVKPALPFFHQHIHETEPYYILSGEGTFIDNDQSKTLVHAGDTCTIEPGQWHSMENNSSEDLIFMALIYND
ncbi:cupin domain-containing protein [Pseudoramibacter porci]|uniref:cupin domain-containing protein n=1 Tax=Pseudoramibacter porci TaxID=2606631 RepID=UPI002E26AE50